MDLCVHVSQVSIDFLSLVASIFIFQIQCVLLTLKLIDSVRQAGQ